MASLSLNSPVAFPAFAMAEVIFEESNVTTLPSLFLMFSNMEAPVVEFVKFVPNERAHDAPLYERPENRKTSASLEMSIDITTY